MTLSADGAVSRASADISPTSGRADCTCTWCGGLLRQILALPALWVQRAIRLPWPLYSVMLSPAAPLLLHSASQLLAAAARPAPPAPLPALCAAAQPAAALASAQSQVPGTGTRQLCAACSWRGHPAAQELRRHA